MKYDGGKGRILKADVIFFEVVKAKPLKGNGQENVEYPDEVCETERRKYYETHFSGHSILKEGNIGLSKNSEQRLKEKLIKITQRKRGVSLEGVIKELATILQGWLNYFQYASMRCKLKAIDGWLRRCLKCFRLKQCKRCIGIVRYLRKLGVEETLCWRTALSGKGWWRLSNSPAVSIGMNNVWFSKLGFYSLFENYNKLHRNLL